ncbi:MAG: assimilatory sulfite reductase (NADPH) flavoprotein subunit [Verrucomicrobiales bacterium]|nr:assimilatory sulfite reductase (NADPH) flavoprotein subunit [Verrucomicrobiales bacterium]
MMKALPVIPPSAPFTEEQKMWLNGYIAGLISEADESPVISSKPKVRVPVLYASQSGNSEGLAEDFAERLSGSGFDAPCFSTEDHGDIDLTKEKHLLLISSTWGEGDPPDNAVEFWKTLESSDHPRLEELSYSVLALGDSNYLDFCKQGKAFDARLEQLGAKRIAPRVDCDTDFEEPAEQWFSAVVAQLGGEEAGQPASARPSSSTATPVGWSKKNPFRAKLLENRRLNGETSDRDTRHFEFDLTGSGLSYEVGDVLGVYPKNNAALVDEMIEKLGFSPDEPVPTSDRGEQALRVALIEDYDITTLSAKVIKDWAERSSSEFLNALLKEGDDELLKDYIWGRELIDLVTDHPAEWSGAGEFVSILRKLGPRLYSISSSPAAHPDQVHLSVAKVTYETHGRIREGVCSTYLADRVNGDGTVPVFFQPAAHFKLPADLATDVIMCGPGTGIAPFRAFLEEREATKAPGRNWLFFGNPHEQTDFLYREQLLGQQEKGILNRLDLAWSRDGDSKVYVQDKMRESGEELWNWLNGGAHFYVCGDAKRMAKDVDAALHHIAATHGGLGEDGAKDFINQLKKEKRYQRDVY